MKLLLILYNVILIGLYIPVGLIGRFLTRKNSPRYWQRLGLGLPCPAKPVKPSIWLHGASVGESRSLTGTVNTLRKQYPEHNIIVSTFTETGYDVVTKELRPDYQFLLPLENPIAVKWIIKQHNVKLIIITDTEIWPNVILSAAKKAPLMLLNGRISDKTLNTYKKWSFFFAPILRSFSYIFAKSEDDAARFRSIGGTSLNVDTGGNIKYRLDNIKSAINPELAALFSGKNIALAASTHNPEEKIFFEAAIQFKSKYDMVLLAPRHIKRSQDIKKSAEELGLSAGLFSENDMDKDILIMDAFGMLESLYQLSGRIFIGGSLADIGGHNVFEALQYRKQVSTGPNIYNFNDIIPMAASYGLVTIVHDKEELLRYFNTEPVSGDFGGFFDNLSQQQRDYEQKINACIAGFLDKE